MTYDGSVRGVCPRHFSCALPTVGTPLRIRLGEVMERTSDQVQLVLVDGARLHRPRVDAQSRGEGGNCVCDFAFRRRWEAAAGGLHADSDAACGE